MACRQYVLEGDCKRANCRYIHDYLYCIGKMPKCRGNQCMQFHLGTMDMQQLKLFQRPFNESVTKETERVAYAIKQQLPASKMPVVCVRHLVGKLCHWKNAPCKFCKRNVTYTNYDNLTWMRCHFCYLPAPEQSLVSCGHLYHTSCLNKIPLDVSGALPEYKCIVCDKNSGMNVRVYAEVVISDSEEEEEGE